MTFCFNQIPFYLNESEFGEANNDGESPTGLILDLIIEESLLSLLTLDTLIATTSHRLRGTFVGGSF